MIVIPNSWLQGGALLAIAVVVVMAAIDGNWAIVNTGLVGLFAVLNIHPKPPGSPPDADAP